MKTGNGYFIKLKILESDMDEVIDTMLADNRIDEEVRTEYGRILKKVMYAGIDDINKGDGHSMSFK